MGSAAGYLKGDDYDGILIEITKLDPDRRNVSSKTGQFFVYFVRVLFPQKFRTSLRY